jgi:hypothetical protein
LSFYLYNTPDEVDRAVDVVAAFAAGRPAPRHELGPVLGGQRCLDQPAAAGGGVTEQSTAEVLHTFA